jgi:hypothetical protein
LDFRWKSTLPARAIPTRKYFATPCASYDLLARHRRFASRGKIRPLADDCLSTMLLFEAKMIGSHVDPMERREIEQLNQLTKTRMLSRYSGWGPETREECLALVTRNRRSLGE